MIILDRKFYMLSKYLKNQRFGCINQCVKLKVENWMADAFVNSVANANKALIYMFCDHVCACADVSDVTFLVIFCIFLVKKKSH